MQPGRKRGRSGVVIEHRAMVKRDPSGQSASQECAPQHELIGFQWWIGGIHTGIALDLEPTHDINNGNQTHAANTVHRHVALGIEFPLIVGHSIGWGWWRWEVAMPLIPAGHFGGFEQSGDTGATGERLIGPGGIEAQFGQQGVGSPAGMRLTHLENGLTQCGRVRAESTGGGTAYVGGQAGAPMPLTTAAPLAHRPDRTTKVCSNHWIRLACSGSFGDVQSLLERRPLPAPYHISSRALAYTCVLEDHTYVGGASDTTL